MHARRAMGDPVQRVLVVEDDAAIAEIVTQVLDHAGHDVVTVSSGADALAFLGRVRAPCLVLLDLKMTDMNGWEVLSALRAARETKHRVVVMSGLPLDQFPRGLPALRKPFTTTELLRTVGATMERAMHARRP